MATRVIIYPYKGKPRGQSFPDWDQAMEYFTAWQAHMTGIRELAFLRFNEDTKTFRAIFIFDKKGLREIPTFIPTGKRHIVLAGVEMTAKGLKAKRYDWAKERVKAEKD